MSGARSPALIIRFPDMPPRAAREGLSARLADHDLVAIHEDDVAAPRRWAAYFATATARDAAAALLASTDPHLEVQAVDVEDEDWARRTQADLPAVRVGRVSVAPPWDVPDGWTPRRPGTVPPPDAEIVVVIEPSRGFGTGHHQSTRLCLALLQTRPLAGLTVLDIGTGSGVLAIAAARLGAAFVSAIDVDPDAIGNARANVAGNGLDGIVEAHVGDITAPAAPPAAHLVLANLTGTLLARHADTIGAAVRRGGSLIASGFTVDEKALVFDAFAPAFDIVDTAEEDDWWAYALTRQTS